LCIYFLDIHLPFRNRQPNKHGQYVLCYFAVGIARAMNKVTISQIGPAVAYSQYTVS